MKRLFIIFAVIIVCFSSCFTVRPENEGILQFLITSAPNNSNITIYNKTNNTLIVDTITPVCVELRVKPSLLDFSRPVYSIEVSRDGYENRTLEIAPESTGWTINDPKAGKRLASSRNARKIHLILEQNLSLDNDRINEIESIGGTK